MNQDMYRPRGQGLLFLFLLFAALAGPVAGQEREPHPERVNAPRAIRMDKPEIPEEVRKRRAGTTVRADFVIDTRGRVTKLRLSGSADAELLSLVREAVSKWRFVPYRYEGEVVEIQFEATFTISSETEPPPPDESSQERSATSSGRS